MTGALLLAATAVQAQLALEGDPGRSERTREDLQRSLAFYQGVVDSPVYSDRVRDMARMDVARIRARLTEGDFRIGDRIVLSVQGEPDLPDTVAVEAGPLIVLPLFGEVPLNGVLRSEIGPHLTEQLRQYIRSPVVRAKALMRVSIQGSVARPGFYVLPADMLLGEALMVAGGISDGADLKEMRLLRGNEVLLRGDDLEEAERLGRTLDQMNMQAGDQIMLPARRGGMLGSVGIVVGILGTLGFLIGQFSR